MKQKNLDFISKEGTFAITDIIILNNKKYHVSIEFNDKYPSVYELILNTIELQESNKKGEEDEYECSIT